MLVKANRVRSASLARRWHAQAHSRERVVPHEWKLDRFAVIARYRHVAVRAAANERLGRCLEPIGDRYVD
jgi:hypothetical protein